MSNRNIPAGKFAEDEEELIRKREELRRRLLNGDKISFENSSVSQDAITIPISYSCHIRYPVEIENSQSTGIIYGQCHRHAHKTQYWSLYLVQTNKVTIESKEIGRIFEEKPMQIPKEGITGYYENGVLRFVNSDGIICEKHPYPLFESWLNGKMEIEYFQTLRHKREEIREQLKRHGLYAQTFICFPAELEQIQATGIFYGNMVCWGYDKRYYISSNSEKQNELGIIYKEKPIQFLPIGITGYYENSVLQFVNSKGIACMKNSYPLFESWLNGEMGIKYLD